MQVGVGGLFDRREGGARYVVGVSALGQAAFDHAAPQFKGLVESYITLMQQAHPEAPDPARCPVLTTIPAASACM